MNGTTFQGDGKVVYVPVVVNEKQPKPITNADRIRQMGNNELALFFWAYVDGKGNSLEQWREWLKQDVREKAFNKLTELTTNREEGE